jgi:hypothetical protein
VEIAKVGETSIGRAYFEPGWNWEKCVKPIAKRLKAVKPRTHNILFLKECTLRWIMALKRT